MEFLTMQNKLGIVLPELKNLHKNTDEIKDSIVGNLIDILSIKPTKTKVADPEENLIK
jgi:hypothetical protein